MKSFACCKLFVMGALVLSLKPNQADAQVALADEIVLLSKAKQEQEKFRTHQHLETPGKGESPYRIFPGAIYPRLGEPVASAGLSTQFLPSSASRLGQGTPPPRIVRAALTTEQKPPQPLYGSLDIPKADDEGPADGLTLDMALDRLVRENHDLLTKFQEIPKADADILSAGLRNNPLIFASADNLPYGNYSPQRPGENGYSVTVIQAVDFNHKRLERIKVAEAAKRVLEAQYQDAVRMEIDNLYGAYIDALTARTGVRFAREGLKGLSEVVELTKKLAEKGVQSKTDVDRVLIQQANAEIALRSAETTYLQAKQNLAVMLNIPAEQVGSLELRGTLRDSGSAFPVSEELVQAAIVARPDLAAYRLGVQRAQAEVTLAKKERFSDAFVLYTPYGFRNNQPTGGQNATSYGLSGMVSVPVFNRNQGNIRRAEVNVAQTQIELNGLQRRIVGEVHKALQDVATTQAALKRFDEQILPSSRRIKDAALSLYMRGQESSVAYLSAQRDYNEMLNQYLELLARNRRNLLRLNTAVGQRIIP